MDDLTTMSVEQLESELREIVDAETPTDEQLDRGEALSAEIDRRAEAEQAEATAAQARADRAAALRSRFAGETDEAAEEEGEEAAEEESEDEGSEEDAEQDEGADAEGEGAPVEAAAKPKPKKRVVAALARKTTKPRVPANAEDVGITITAAADVPDVATGSRFAGLMEVGQAAQRKLSLLPAPQGTGEGEDLRKFPVASFKMDFEHVLDDRTPNLDEVLDEVARESRLSSEQGEGSLVAAGGWCSPSETIYDLCGEEVVDGIASLPEVSVKRGGLRYTEGTDFSTIYAGIGFTQTETQAIAGTTKPCYEIPCPTFSETRLDVTGLCIKIPILTEVGYPEQVKDVTAKALIAFQYKVNADVIGRMLALSPAAVVAAGMGSVASDTLEILDQIAMRKRQQYRLGRTKTLEVMLPVHAEAMFRNDVERRTGSRDAAVQDSYLRSFFAVRKLNVQYVYGWQELPLADVGGTAGVREDIAWPTTFDALIYPAGTFTKGTADVINLSAVYDAASLAVNTYTGLFMEEGLMVFRRCYTAFRVTIPVCTAGRTGAANLTCA